MPKPVYALVGDDSFLQVQELSRIASTLGEDAQRIEFDGERAELAEVLDELRSFAMFGGGSKLVVVRFADDFISRFREQLEDYLEKPSSSATLVLRVNSLSKSTRVYKLIAKIGQVIECAPPSGRALPGWIVNRAKTVHKINVANESAVLMTELIGADLGRLDNELAKIALVCGDKRAVSPDDIRSCVTFQRDQEMWELTNELAIGRIAGALKRWRRLLELDPSSEFRAITWIGMWLEDVGVVVSNGNTGKLAWKYKDRMNQFVTTAKSMGKSRHAKAVDLLTRIDRRTKSGLGDAPGNVERFILSLSN